MQISLTGKVLQNLEPRQQEKVQLNSKSKMRYRLAIIDDWLSTISYPTRARGIIVKYTEDHNYSWCTRQQEQPGSSNKSADNVFSLLKFSLRCVTDNVNFEGYTLIDHSSRPMSTQEFSYLMYKRQCAIALDRSARENFLT